MFLAMTPPGSTDSSTVPWYGPPVLKKYHQGIPFCAVTTMVAGPHSAADVRRHAGHLVGLQRR